KLAKRVVDPHVSPLRAEPRDQRDLSIAAQNSWLVAWDNLSFLQWWLSDALCRLATGGGLSTRRLYTDADEVFFNSTRPAIVNGIEDFVTRGDLIDRCLFLHLPTISETKRKTESDFWASANVSIPAILGALLDAVSGGLRELPAVQLSHL